MDELTSQQRGKSKIEYDFDELRSDFGLLRDRVSEKIAEMHQDIKNLTNKINLSGAKVGGYSIKELAQLKALGIRPQDILRDLTSDNHEKTQEIKQNIHSNVPRVQKIADN